MGQVARRTAELLCVAVFTLALTVAPIHAQNALESLTKDEISQRVGIDPDLLATLIVSDGGDRFILAFVRIDESLLDSRLKPLLKRGIEPFIGRKALLVLVFPLQLSRFVPSEISFSQEGLTYLTDNGQIHSITDDFQSGIVRENELSAGVIELPGVIDLTRPFTIRFRGSFTTQYAATASFQDRSSGQAALISAKQGASSWRVFPLKGRASAEDFYAYTEFHSENRLIKDDTSLVFLYQERDTPSDGLNLFILHQSSRSSHVRFTFFGLPRSISVLVEDDSDDAYWISPPTGKINWRWSSGLTDGVVFGGLNREFSLTITPEFQATVSHWALISGTLQDPEYIELPSLDAPLTLTVERTEPPGDSGPQPGSSSDPAEDPVARFSFSPAEPRVGESVTFDASASRSPVTEVMQYDWDFDGDGSFEVRTGSPIVTRRFRSPGEHRVTLRVEDGQGRQALASTTVHVRALPVQVTRHIRTFLPNFQALPGTHFIVQLMVETNTTVVGLGIQESVPDGWEIEPVESRGARYNSRTSEWLFLETLLPGEKRKLLYRAEVPQAEDPGSFTFSGRVVSGDPEFASQVVGDEEVELIFTIPVRLAVSRLNEQGEIDITLSNLISFDQILQAIALWQGRRTVPGTNGIRINLDSMVELVAYWRTGTPVHRSLPSNSP